MSKKNKTIEDLKFNISNIDQAVLDAKMIKHIKWIDDHPNFDEYYGTDKSYMLQDIVKAGFNPIAITVMLCEETFIFETFEESERAANMFLPDGWWYSYKSWDKKHTEYVNRFYKEDSEMAPTVYWLSDKYRR